MRSTKSPALPAKAASDANLSYSAIICLWRRKSYLREQVEAVLAQSRPPEEIIFLINEGHIRGLTADVKALLRRRKYSVLRSSLNSLYTRWAISYIAEGRFVWILDDDVIPGARWAAHAMKTSLKHNALVGPRGRIYNPKGHHGFYTAVTPQPDEAELNISCAGQDIRCDWLCNSYLFQRAWVAHALSEPRFQGRQMTTDDIQLAVNLFRSAGIESVVARQPPEHKGLRGILHTHYGSDDHALWKRRNDEHFAVRKEYCEQLIAAGHEFLLSRVSDADRPSMKNGTFNDSR